jgi:SAM-dependent methyltransferase
MRKVVDESWDGVWKDFKGLNFFGKILYLRKEKAFREALNVYIPKKSSMVDVGCGSGNVLSILRKIGYRKSIGIDPSENALKACKMKGFLIGKDVFKGDSSSWKKKYDVVWSDGLLEHFDYVDMKEIAKDFVRMSNRFIGFAQPNPNSIILKIAKALGGANWEWERPYEKELYIKVFESLGFHLIHFSYINFKEEYLFIFEKSEG